MQKSILFLLILLLLSGCAADVETPATSAITTFAATQAETTTSDNTFEYHYNLGVRYLSEGNYQEAILAFTAAIEIDPKSAPAFVGRGDAYIGNEEQADSISLAKSDYETALDLDDRLAAAWLGLVDVYIRTGDFDKAEETLRRALEVNPDDPALTGKLSEMQSGEIRDSSNRVHKSISFLPDGTLHTYTIYEYNSAGHKRAWTHYDADNQITGSCIVDFDAQGRSQQYNHFDAQGQPSYYATFEYNEKNQLAEQYVYNTDGELEHYFVFEYDEQGRRIQYSGFQSDGSRYGYWVAEYDDSGNLIGEKQYNDDGELEFVETFE